MHLVIGIWFSSTKQKWMFCCQLTSLALLSQRSFFTCLPTHTHSPPSPACPTHPSADLPTCQMNTSPTIHLFIISASHMPNAGLLTFLLNSLYISPISYSSKFQPANLPYEYRSQFIYCKFLYPPSADLPTCLLLLPVWSILVFI